MRRAPARRVFRTVLFTDIVGSTQLAAQLGDRRWRRTVANHHAVVRRELRRHHGREVDTAGDGFFAIFENPTDAVRCAAAAIAGVHGIGLRIRAGIHTGEVEAAGETVGGIAVHIGARLLAMAGMEEVLVSGTVRELVAGSGHVFEDRGTHELRGVPGEWHVYRLVLPQLDESIAVSAIDDADDVAAASARRQRLVVLSLLGVIALLLIAMATAAILGSRAQPPAVAIDRVVAFDTAGTAAVASWQVGRGPEAVDVAEGALWVASTASGTVSRIDLTTGGAVSVGQAGTRPSDVLVANGRTWVADRYANQLAVLDGRNGDLVDRLQVHSSALAFGIGSVWAADDVADRLIRIDPVTNAQISVVELPSPAGPSDLAAAAGAIWVVAPRAGDVLKVNPADGAVTPVGLDLSLPRGLESHGDDIWVVSPSSDTVARLDAAAGRVAVRVSVCDNPVALAPTPQGVWVACATDRALWRLDRAGDIIAQIELPAVPADVDADGDRAWVALRAD